MSRLTLLRRKCPDVIQKLISKAQQSQFFILQEVGPMAFVLSGYSGVKRPHTFPSSLEMACNTSNIRDQTHHAKPLHPDDSPENIYINTNTPMVCRDRPHAVFDTPPLPSTHSATELPADSPATLTFKKVKVGLGLSQTCTCSKHMMDNDLCIHILWVMLKVFHIDPKNDMIYQTSLVDREIEEMLDNRRRKATQLRISVTPKLIKESIPINEPGDAHDMNPSLKSGETEPRKIDPGDVCAICQEELLNLHEPLAHCRFSCGNSIHTKCMNVLMDYQAKTLGMEKMECPLCRGNFGSMDELKKTFFLSKRGHNTIRGDASHQLKEKEYIHMGSQCQECKISPIAGNLHICAICLDVQMCGACFKAGAHSQHSFNHRIKRTGKLIRSKRVVDPMLPPNLVAQLEQRDITESDYEMLLTLDTPQQQGSIPLHIINKFPVIKLKGPKDKELVRLGEGTDGTCGVCQIKVGYGELVRQIPCGHGFHQPCIDRWLLYQRTVCPKCGLAAYSSTPLEDTDLDHVSLKPNTDAAIYHSSVSNIYGSTVQRHVRKVAGGNKKEAIIAPSRTLGSTERRIIPTTKSKEDSQSIDMMVFGSNAISLETPRSSVVPSTEISNLTSNSNTKTILPSLRKNLFDQPTTPLLLKPKAKPFQSHSVILHSTFLDNSHNLKTMKHPHFLSASDCASISIDGAPVSTSRTETSTQKPLSFSFSKSHTHTLRSSKSSHQDTNRPPRLFVSLTPKHVTHSLELERHAPSEIYVQSTRSILNKER
ncbi:hypothetical protein BASA50_002808 [Batrachochytrium salamandrivorans]|uniref:RING-type domain-containing protein n=1 Tax=Batrachochytrium salamandrivorans TaxID=1357716 RepID=A0ABQ8FKC6_9FUNG|nr:hypothetical protein BASA50_002808 [Batrachochytrium salamandrivorans]